MRTVKRSISILVLAIGFTSSTEACSCAPTPPVCEAYWQANAVFVGVPVGRRELKESDSSTVAYRFLVQDPWRGVKDKEVEVRTGYGGGDCGYVFEFGKSYLIYSWGGNAQPLRTGICSRTRQLETASESIERYDLHYLC
jgi:hypothetical protein